jgi:ribonuclease J
VVPGNERTVQTVKDMLIRHGAQIFHYQMMDVHAGGHAQKEDIKLLLRMINPKYYIPIEGNLHLLHDNGNVAKELGWQDDQVMITSNGQIMEFAGGSGQLTKEKIPSDYVFVDGLGVGDVSEVVLRDRQLLAEDGMFVIIVTIDAHNGQVVGTPDVISRGFIYSKGNNALIEEARAKVIDIVKPHLTQEAPNSVHIKNKLREAMGQFLFEKIQRRPMILPVIVEV